MIKNETIFVGDEVTIHREVYDEMVEDIAFLRALEGAGVDNWDGYGDAQEMMDD